MVREPDMPPVPRMRSMETVVACCAYVACGKYVRLIMNRLGTWQKVLWGWDMVKMV